MSEVRVWARSMYSAGWIKLATGCPFCHVRHRLPEPDDRTEWSLPQWNGRLMTGSVQCPVHNERFRVVWAMSVEVGGEWVHLGRHYLRRGRVAIVREVGLLSPHAVEPTVRLSYLSNRNSKRVAAQYLLGMFLQDFVPNVDVT